LAKTVALGFKCSVFWLNSNEKISVFEYRNIITVENSNKNKLNVLKICKNDVETQAWKQNGDIETA